jgi:adenylate cyclase
LLEFLARSLVDQPILFLVTARTSRTDRQGVETLASLPDYREIPLSQLPPGDAAELATEWAHQLNGREEEPAPETIERIVERASGNPFYIEELLSLVQVRGPDQYGDFDLPDSVERVVMARLDRLSEGEKAVLKVASDVGRRFRAEWISGCYPAAGSPAEVARHLRSVDALAALPRARTPGRRTARRHSRLPLRRYAIPALAGAPL